MSTKAYRNYYERLAQAREKLRKELVEKAKKRSFWSINYKASFKWMLYEMFSRKMNFIQSPAVVDVGCGRGSDLSVLSRKFSFVGYGIDFSLIRLKAALDDEYLRKFNFVQGDVQQLPFKDSISDIVICSEVIEHLPKSGSCLKEIQRILKKDGLLLLTTPNRWDYFHALGQFIPKSLRKRITKQLRGEEVDVDSSEYVTEKGMEEHIHLFTIRELKTCLEKMGFRIEEIRGGMLTVPIPRLFDRFVFLQKFWVALDKIVSLFPPSLCIKATILLVCRKNK